MPEGIDKAAAVRDLVPALDRARRALGPADPAHITDCLTTLAATLQVSMPEEAGILTYIGALQTMPRRALNAGFREIVKTFTYPRLPFPGELLTACAYAEAELLFWHQAIERSLKLLEKQS